MDQSPPANPQPVLYGRVIDLMLVFESCFKHCWNHPTLLYFALMKCGMSRQLESGLPKSNCARKHTILGGNREGEKIFLWFLECLCLLSYLNFYRFLIFFYCKCHLKEIYHLFILESPCDFVHKQFTWCQIASTFFISDKSPSTSIIFILNINFQLIGTPTSSHSFFLTIHLLLAVHLPFPAIHLIHPSTCFHPSICPPVHPSTCTYFKYH